MGVNWTHVGLADLTAAEARAMYRLDKAEARVVDSEAHGDSESPGSRRQPMTTDPIEALTEILQQHTGCYSDDRSRERCVAHGTDWPCDQLSAMVAEVQSWHEAQAPAIIHKGYVPDYDHAAWDEQPGPTCETDHENCDIADEACCDGCATGLGPCYGPGIRPVCHNEIHRSNA